MAVTLQPALKKMTGTFKPSIANRTNTKPKRRHVRFEQDAAGLVRSPSSRSDKRRTEAFLPLCCVGEINERWLSEDEQGEIRRLMTTTAKCRQTQDKDWIELEQSNRSFSHVFARVYIACHKHKDLSCRDGNDEDRLILPRQHALQHRFMNTGVDVRGVEDYVCPQLGLQRRSERRKYIQAVCAAYRENILSVDDKDSVADRVREIACRRSRPARALALFLGTADARAVQMSYYGVKDLILTPIGNLQVSPVVSAESSSSFFSP